MSRLNRRGPRERALYHGMRKKYGQICARLAMEVGPCQPGQPHPLVVVFSPCHGAGGATSRHQCAPFSCAQPVCGLLSTCLIITTPRRTLPSDAQHLQGGDCAACGGGCH